MFTISVAIAAYNGEEFISAQLDSILNQTVEVTEIVICDDNSTDKTWDIVQSYREKYPELFKIFRNDKNSGCSGNFEKALFCCSGDIIFLADQDDVWQKNKVEKMLQPFTDPGVLGVYSDSLIVDRNLESLNCTHLQLRGYSPARLGAMPQVETFARRVPPAAHDMAIRRKTLKYLLPFPRLKNVHDTFIGVAIAAQYGWAVIPETLTLFRQHGNNASNSGQKQTLAGMFRTAKKSIADDTFLWNAKLYSFTLARLKAQLDDKVEMLLKERVLHSENRSKMGKVNFFYRLWLIIEELFSFRYFRFARGLKSVIQDIFLQ